MDKEKLLKEVWKNCTFDEIINAGFEYNKCGAIDLKVAAAEFDDPDKEYDIEDVIKECKLNEICNALQNEYDLGDIIDTLGLDDILSEISDDDMLEHLKDTYTLESWEDEIKEEYYNDMYQEIKSDWDWEEKQILEEILPDKPDDWREFLCDHYINCSYYDNEKFNKGLKDIIDKINKSSYA
jgi:hypothetical protein